MADNFLEAMLAPKGDYLPDGPVAIAVLGRLVEGAIIFKVLLHPGRVGDWRGSSEMPPEPRFQPPPHHT
jgi:hypothetical protein